jgi:hypothetical protein
MPKTKKPMVHHALCYARRGWRVFPLQPRTKIPLEGTRGFLDATTDRAQIKRWWIAHPTANIGIACDSAHGPIVLDVDGRSGHRSLRTLALPETRMAASRAGKLHLYFASPENGQSVARLIKPFLTKRGKRAKLDILGDGGYVVAPPSVHPDTGKPYRWTKKIEPAPLPTSVLERIAAARPHHLAEPLPDVIPEGQRDNVLTSLAGSMRRRNATPAAILAALREQNERCVPPLNDGDLQRIARSIGAKAPATATATRGIMHATPLSKVKARPVRWLWRHYLPLETLVMLDGHPGLGKSGAMLDLAARGSRGRKMPDGTRGDVEGAWDTLVLTYEDVAANTLRPRVEAAGGKLSRVHVITGVTRGDDVEVPASLPEDIDALEGMLKEHPRTRLVMIDPLMAALSSDVDSHRDQDVRRVLARLARLAQQYNLCIVLIRHLRKTTGGNAITAGGGSIGIGGAARAVLMVHQHPEQNDGGAEMAVLSCVKSNLGPKPPSLAYAKGAMVLQNEEGESIETVRVEWKGAVPYSADELLAASERRGSSGKSSEVTAWLAELLSSRTELDRKTIMELADVRGFPEYAVYRAAKQLGIHRERTGSRGESRSIWTLPDRDEIRVS